MVSFKRRTLIESDLYSVCKDSLGVDCKRLDEILEGITTKIAVEPDFFPRAPGLKGVRRARTQEFPPDIPSFRVWYTYDSQTVVLHLIEITAPGELPVPD